jgi:hypothetical protein
MGLGNDLPYDLTSRLVVGIASSALFGLAESDAIFRDEGEEGYRYYQEEHLDDPLMPGCLPVHSAVAVAERPGEH